MQTDPIGYYGGINLYSYVANNPLNYVDPMGLCGEKFDYGAAYWDSFSEGVNEDLQNMFSEGVAYGAEISLAEPTTKGSSKENKLSFWDRLGEIFKAVFDAPSLPAIGTTEAVYELGKFTPKAKKRNKEKYEGFGEVTGKWGEDNMYYGLPGVSKFGSNSVKLKIMGK